MISKYVPKLQMNSKCVSRTKVCTGALSASGCAVGAREEVAYRDVKIWTILWGTIPVVGVEDRKAELVLKPRETRNSIRAKKQTAL